MADVAVAGTGEVEYLTADTALVQPAGQAVTTGNTAVLTPQAAADGTPDVPGRPFKGRYMLVRMVESGAVATSTATVKAGDNPPSQQSARGDRAAETFTSGQVKYLQVDLNRYLQNDGTVRVDVGGAGGSVTFTVLQLDENA